MDRLYRLSKTRYRQTAGIAENLNQIAKQLYKQYRLTDRLTDDRWSNWDNNFKAMKKLSIANRDDDKHIWQKLKAIEKKMNINANYS